MEEVAATPVETLEDSTQNCEDENNSTEPKKPNETPDDIQTKPNKKPSKKAIIIGLVVGIIVIVLGLIFALGAKDPIIGTWNLHSISMDGVNVIAEEKFLIEFENDGTAEFKSLDKSAQELNVTWSANESMSNKSSQIYNINATGNEPGEEVEDLSSTYLEITSENEDVMTWDIDGFKLQFNKVD